MTILGNEKWDELSISSEGEAERQQHISQRSVLLQGGDAKERFSRGVSSECRPRKRKSAAAEGLSVANKVSCAQGGATAAPVIDLEDSRQRRHSAVHVCGLETFQQFSQDVAADPIDVSGGPGAPYKPEALLQQLTTPQRTRFGLPSLLLGISRSHDRASARASARGSAGEKYAKNEGVSAADHAAAPGITQQRFGRASSAALMSSSWQFSPPEAVSCSAWRLQLGGLTTITASPSSAPISTLRRREAVQGFLAGSSESGSHWRQVSAFPATPHSSKRHLHPRLESPFVAALETENEDDSFFHDSEEGSSTVAGASDRSLVDADEKTAVDELSTLWASRRSPFDVSARRDLRFDSLATPSSISATNATNATNTTTTALKASFLATSRAATLSRNRCVQLRSSDDLAKAESFLRAKQQQTFPGTHPSQVQSVQLSPMQPSPTRPLQPFPMQGAFRETGNTFGRTLQNIESVQGVHGDLYLSRGAHCVRRRKLYAHTRIRSHWVKNRFCMNSTSTRSPATATEFSSTLLSLSSGEITRSAFSCDSSRNPGSNVISPRQLLLLRLRGAVPMESNINISPATVSGLRFSPSVLLRISASPQIRKKSGKRLLKMLFKQYGGTKRPDTPRAVANGTSSSGSLPREGDSQRSQKTHHHHHRRRPKHQVALSDTPSGLPINCKGGSAEMAIALFADTRTDTLDSQLSSTRGTNTDQASRGTSCDIKREASQGEELHKISLQTACQETHNASEEGKVVLLLPTTVEPLVKPGNTPRSRDVSNSKPEKSPEVVIPLSPYELLTPSALPVALQQGPLRIATFRRILEDAALETPDTIPQSARVRTARNTVESGAAALDVPQAHCGFQIDSPGSSSVGSCLAGHTTLSGSSYFSRLGGSSSASVFSPQTVEIDPTPTTGISISPTSNAATPSSMFGESKAAANRSIVGRSSATLERSIERESGVERSSSAKLLRDLLSRPLEAQSSTPPPSCSNVGSNLLCTPPPLPGAGSSAAASSAPPTASLPWLHWPFRKSKAGSASRVKVPYEATAGTCFTQQHAS